MLKRIGLVILTLALAAVFAGPALGEFPDRPIKILVGFKAGGGTDTMARLLAKKAGDILGQPVVVINKTGGGGAIAAKAVLGSEPDGYNLVFSITLTFAGWPHMTKTDYTYEDFTYIASVGKFQEAFVAGVEKPFKDWKGLIEAAKKKEGGLNAAVMTPYDKMVLRYIAKKEGVKFNLVPTKSGPEIMTQVLGGHVDFGFSGGIHYTYVKAGKMNVLAGHGAKRLVGTPDVPTLKELGYDVVLENYCMVAGPKGMPADIVKKLGDAFTQATQDKDYQDLMNNKLHFPLATLGPDELPAQIKEMDGVFKRMAEALK